MPSDARTVTVDIPEEPRPEAAAVVTGLVLLWSRDEPHRVGELALMPGGFPGASARLGRAASEAGDPVRRIEFVRQRPGSSTRTGPLRSPQLSREQLRLDVGADGALLVENVGRAPLLLNGLPVTRALVRVGDVLELVGIALLRCSARPFAIATAASGAAEWPTFEFGVADAFGIVGESPAAWALRNHVAFLAQRTAHVLVRGPSGAGKELVVRALHGLSNRSKQRLVARNAATIPESLVDAELFGNVKNYPNPGMAERVGLIGEADGTTLFLDEFGELPPSAQAHLLRVLDEGDYHRLGDARSRRVHLRLIAATNRPVESLKEDVAARLRLRVEVPGLAARRDDIPLLVRHLLRRIARAEPTIAQQWFPDGDPEQPPRISAALMSALVRHPYRTHTRELEALLWTALAQTGPALQVWPELLSAPLPDEPVEVDEPPAPGPPGIDPMSIPVEELQAALDRHQGRQSAAWRELGLTSRHVLARLVKRHGLVVRREDG